MLNFNNKNNRTMKKYNFLFLISVLLLLSNCTNDFEAINTNPNQPEVVTPNLLLSTVISSTVSRNALTGWNNGNIVSQLTAKINFTGFDRYDWGSESGLWNHYYGNLSEIEQILQISRNETSKNTSYEGIALVLRSWIYSNLTDNWGDVPFSEAIKGQTEGNFTPVYDSQEEIYTGVLADLVTAETLLKQGQPILGGDLLYNGDLLKWRKLTNSLRLRYLMRISKRKDVSAEIQQIVTEGMIFTSNADNAVLKYAANSQVDSWPISNGRIGSFDEHRLSKTSETVLKDFEDNRLFSWFQPTDNKEDDPNLFAGMLNGLSEDNASTFNGGANNVSRLNQSFFYDAPDAVEAPLMQYAEVQFILAEAAQKGFILEDAKTFYENGVIASFEYWNTTQDFENYLSQEGVAYDGSLETIMTQKWLASFLVGLESWYDFRRTGLPSFIVPGQDNVNNNQVPVRFLYPDNEQTLNTENYQNAVSKMGSDDINIKGWWEK